MLETRLELTSQQNINLAVSMMAMGWQPRTPMEHPVLHVREENKLLLTTLPLIFSSSPRCLFSSSYITISRKECYGLTTTTRSTFCMPSTFEWFSFSHEAYHGLVLMVFLCCR